MKNFLLSGRGVPSLRVLTRRGSHALHRGLDRGVLLGAALTSLGILAARLLYRGGPRERPELQPEQAIPPGDDGALDRMTTPMEAQHRGQSAFRLINEGPEFFAALACSAEQAARSLDIQAYVWRADDTGMFLAHALLRAADRGVQIRLLLDDMDARQNNNGLAALTAHPHVRIRMFNPFRTRRGLAAMVREGMMNFRRLNRRMHNKSWIADNRIAFAGGRNIGDQYFGASHQTNFIDLDFAMIGPIVRDASASFDRYWNSPAACPVEFLASVGYGRLESLRSALGERAHEVAASRYAGALQLGDAIKHLVAGDWPMEWSARYAFAADDPIKATQRREAEERKGVRSVLLAEIEKSRTDLTIVSPYFVPGRRLAALLIHLARAGKRVRVLTNSLAANDVVIVHGGYSRYRESLLAGGVQLWELKPLNEDGSGLFGSSGAALHTKALAVDGRIVFVGSYNLDPRSKWLNCEQVVMVESTALAAQLDTIFEIQTSGERAWEPRLGGNGLSWHDGSECFTKDPCASPGRRLVAWVARTLRLEAQL